MNENLEFETSLAMPMPEILKIPNDDDVAADPGPALPGALVDELPSTDDYAEYFAKALVLDELILIEKIQQIHQIPYYRTPTTSDLPIVLVNREGIYCLDGPDKIEAARKSGASSMKCRAIFKDCSSAMLPFEKGAMRMKTPGGYASQAELVEIVVCVAADYTFNHPQMFTNRNGGVRIKGQHNTQAEDNLINALSNGLGKDQRTVRKYLNHGEYLDFSILKELADAQVPKNFFEGIQKAKGQIVQILQGRGLENSEIVTQISEAFRTILIDYRAKDNKLDQVTLKTVVTQFTAPAPEPPAPEPAAPEQQPPVATGGNIENEVTPAATDTRDQAANNEEPPAVSNDESLLEPSDTGRFEQRQDRVIETTSMFAAQAVDATDNEDLNDLARDILTFGFDLCSELLPHDLETIMEDLKAAYLG